MYLYFPKETNPQSCNCNIVDRFQIEQNRFIVYWKIRIIQFRSVHLGAYNSIHSYDQTDQTADKAKNKGYNCQKGLLDKSTNHKFPFITFNNPTSTDCVIQN